MRTLNAMTNKPCFCVVKISNLKKKTSSESEFIFLSGTNHIYVLVYIFVYASAIGIY